MASPVEPKGFSGLTSLASKPDFHDLHSFSNRTKKIKRIILVVTGCALFCVAGYFYQWQKAESADSIAPETGAITGDTPDVNAIMEAQRLLEALGYCANLDSGDLAQGIRNFQRDFGLPQTGELNKQTIDLLDTIYNDLLDWIKTGKRPAWIKAE